MGRWAYYSPLVLGVLLVLGLHETVLADARIARLGPRGQWFGLAVVCLVTAAVCQLLMIGTQGAFARVLPVPGGRSIRGTPAAVCGVLILASIGTVLTAGLFAFEYVTRAAVVLAATSAGLAVVALLVYLWQLPVAARDFDKSSV